MNTSLNDSPRFVDPFWRWQKDNEGNWIKYNITLDDCHPIDLNKRTIDVPECLSVEKDHRAETIYFKVDRYFGGMDLATADCIIMYETANKKQYIYCVEGYNLFAEDRMLVFAWPISGLATSVSGKIKFTMMFYRLNKNPDGSVEFDYKLNLRPNISSILYGMDVFDSIIAEDDNTPPSEYKVTPNELEHLQAQINQITSLQQTYWYDV